MDLKEFTEFLPNMEGYYIYSREQILGAEKTTKCDLEFSRKIFNKMVEETGKHYPPHVLYHFANWYNNALWYSMMDRTIHSEELSDAQKKECVSELGYDYLYDMCERQDFLFDTIESIFKSLYEFDDKHSERWSVNSAARTLIDNLLTFIWKDMNHAAMMEKLRLKQLEKMTADDDPNSF